jgi:uncharacterized lipoprotein YddW (UPF0748 family)
MKVGRRLIGPVLAGGLLLLLATVALAQGTGDIFFPIIYHTEAPTPTPIPTPPPPPPPPGHMVEFRGLWVTRFDWIAQPYPSTIDRIVNEAAYAGFNALLFQVRGEADAYYESSLVPWSQRLTGELGRAPGWDPLAYMIARAHERGIQVHAYINVYPVWLGTTYPSSTAQPTHLYFLLQQWHGVTDDKNNGLQWHTSDNIIRGNSVYLRATPASVALDNHLLAVVQELVTHYNLDGIHLDHARYAGRDYSCDPVSEANFGGDCFSRWDYGDWQRRQINGTVSKFYRALFEDPAWTAGRRLNLSAAVWPLYESGRTNYYQDSKAWIQGAYIDTLIPMIYSSLSEFDASVANWRDVAKGFHDDRAGRFVFPGLGSNHYDSFGEIAGRIEASRSLGTGGHAIFSYGGLASRDYFDDLRNGPYAVPAVPPAITWHP